MIKFIKNLLGIGKTAPVVAQAPYKVEAPEEKVVITRAVAPVSNPNVIVTPVTEGKTKGGNNAVKKATPSNNKPAKPQAAKPAKGKPGKKKVAKKPHNKK